MAGRPRKKVVSFPWGKEEHGIKPEMWATAKDRTSHLRHEYHLRRTPIEVMLQMAYFQGILDAAETLANRDMLKTEDQEEEPRYLPGLA